MFQWFNGNDAGGCDKCCGGKNGFNGEFDRECNGCKSCDGSNDCNDLNNGCMVLDMELQLGILMMITLFQYLI